nr:hypothetical protein [Scylla paramamosain]
MRKRQLSTLGYYVSVIPYMEYNRKSLRAKLSCLDRSLKEGSSLCLDGRVESAWVNLKASMEKQEEMIG